MHSSHSFLPDMRTRIAGAPSRQCSAHASPRHVPQAPMPQELALQTLLQRVRGGPKTAPKPPAPSAPKTAPSAPKTAPKAAPSAPKTAPSAPKRPAKPASVPKPPVIPSAKRTESRAKAQPLPILRTAGTPSKVQDAGRQASLELDLSEEESDRLFNEVASVVAAQGLSALDSEDLDMDTDNLGQTDINLGQSSTSSAGTFKGFGAPPREFTSGEPSPRSSHASPVQQTSSDRKVANRPQAGSAKLSAPVRKPTVPALRIFLYASETSKTQEALQQAGWAEQVVVSEDLRSSHVVVSTKLARNGKHNKLQQGDRTARNAGVPFVCVGRHMTRDNLVLALAPVLHSHRARHGVVDERALASAIAKAGVSSEAVAEKARVAAARLQPGWKDRMLKELGLVGPVPGTGVVLPVPAADTAPAPSGMPLAVL